MYERDRDRFLKILNSVVNFSILFLAQVELMGGHLTVSSKEHHGSTFTFVLPHKVSPLCESSDENDEMSDMGSHDTSTDANEDDANSGFFQFQPRTLGSLFSSHGSGRAQKLSPNTFGFNTLQSCNGLPKNSYTFPANSVMLKDMGSVEDACSVIDVDILSDPESSFRQSSHSDNPSTLERDKHAHSGSNGQCHHHSSYSTDSTSTRKDEDVKTAVQEKRQPEGNSPCSSGNNQEVSKSAPKPRILLVEDNKINVMVTQSMMKQLGHQIDIVNNGTEAVRAVQRSCYDLILMVIFGILCFFYTSLSRMQLILHF